MPASCTCLARSTRPLAPYTRPRTIAQAARLRKRTTPGVLFAILAQGDPALGPFEHIEQPPPFGIARSLLGEFIPKRSTSKAAYALDGVPVAASRRLTLTLDVSPCERPKEKPPPEVEALPYYPGRYLENATVVTIKLELARPLRHLPPAPPPALPTAPADVSFGGGHIAPSDQLQRMVVLLRCAETGFHAPTLPVCSKMSSALAPPTLQVQRHALSTLCPADAARHQRREARV